MGTPDDMGDDALPKMVKISLKSQDEGGKEKPLVLSSIIHIPGSG